MYSLSINNAEKSDLCIISRCSSLSSARVDARFAACRNILALSVVYFYRRLQKFKQCRTVLFLNDLTRASPFVYSEIPNPARRRCHPIILLNFSNRHPNACTYTLHHLKIYFCGKLTRLVLKLLQSYMQKE